MTIHDSRRTPVGNILDGVTDLVTVNKIAGRESTANHRRLRLRPEQRDERAQHAAVGRLP
jgi:hypothetical protein